MSDEQREEWVRLMSELAVSNPAEYVRLCAAAKAAADKQERMAEGSTVIPTRSDLPNDS